MMLSYALPSSLMDSQSVVLLITGEHACPICKEEILYISGRERNEWAAPVKHKYTTTRVASEVLINELSVNC
jgi:hypothetical protein